MKRAVGLVLFSLGVDPLPYTEGLPGGFADSCSIASQ